MLSAIRDRNQLDTRTVDDVIFGTSMQVGTQGGDLARMALLDAGYDTMASGVTLDRFCGSGITTTNIAAAQVMSGMEDVIIAGGCEMMSLHPALGAAQAGVRAPLMDAGNLRLRARHPQTHQGAVTFVAMALTIAALTLGYGLTLVLLVKGLATRLQASPWVGRWLEKLAGVCLIGFGLRLVSR